MGRAHPTGGSVGRLLLVSHANGFLPNSAGRVAGARRDTGVSSPLLRAAHPIHGGGLRSAARHACSLDCRTGCVESSRAISDRASQVWKFRPGQRAASLDWRFRGVAHGNGWRRVWLFSDRHWSQFRHVVFCPPTGSVTCGNQVKCINRWYAFFTWPWQAQEADSSAARSTISSRPRL